MRSRHLAPACLLAAAVALPGAGPAGAAGRDPAAAHPFVRGELIVRFKPGVSAAERADARRDGSATLERSLPIPRTQLLELEPGTPVRPAAAAFERDPRIEYAHPNYLYRTSTVPDDPFFGELWGLHNSGQTLSTSPPSGGAVDADIDAPEAWDVTTGSDGVAVAVVDTGISPDHPDVAGQLMAGRDFVHDDAVGSDLDGHGTHVAATIGARGNDGAGITGVAQRVRLMPLRALDHTGGGSTADVASAFDYAGEAGVRIVNASLGTSSYDPTLEQAILAHPDTLFVTAAGNGDPSGGLNNETLGSEYPCELPAPNILCVAASDQGDGRAWFSNWGPQSVDLAAPGTEIYSAAPAFSTVFQELFEVDLAAWTEGELAGGIPLEHDVPWARTTAPGSFSQGMAGLADSPAGNYPNNANTFVRTAAPVDLTGSTGCQVIFDLRLDVADPGDVLRLEAATSPTGQWTTLFSQNADTGGFETFAADLKGYHGAYDFYGQSVYLRFRLQSGPGATADGAYVDWVEVVCLGPGGGHTYSSGTSMAVPHVAGTAALVLAAAPEMSAGELKQTILSTADPVASWSGRTVTGGRLNAAGAVAAAAGVDTQAMNASTGGAPQPAGSASTAGQSAASLPDREPPIVRLTLARVTRLSTVLRRGLRARIHCSEACRGQARLYARSRSGRRVAIGRGHRSTSAEGSAVMKIALSRRGRAVLRRSARPRLTLVVTFTDAAGNRRTLTRRPIVRR